MIGEKKVSELQATIRELERNEEWLNGRIAELEYRLLARGAGLDAVIDKAVADGFYKNEMHRLARKLVNVETEYSLFKQEVADGEWELEDLGNGEWKRVPRWRE